MPSDSYKIVTADLRDTAALEEALSSAGANFSAPTIFLVECVLVYMEPAESAALLQVSRCRAMVLFDVDVRLLCCSRRLPRFFVAYETAI